MALAGQLILVATVAVLTSGNGLSDKYPISKLSESKECRCTLEIRIEIVQFAKKLIEDVGSSFFF